MFQAFKNKFAMALGLSAAGTLTALPALAQITTTDVISSIDAAGDSGITVGQAVIGVIATFVVVGVIIGMVRKLG